jgi:hypothetical protein
LATEKWVGGSGVGLTWSSAFASEAASIANGNAIRSTVVVTNSTALDIFADVSYVTTSGITSAAPNYLGLYLYPQNNDNSTYGDGRFGSSAAGPPPSNYYVGTLGMPATTSYSITGTWSRIVLPPGTFSFVLYNQSGSTLPATYTLQYRTYNRSVA